MNTLLEYANWFLGEENEKETPETPEEEKKPEVDNEQAQAQAKPQPNKEDEEESKPAPEYEEEKPQPVYEEIKKWLDENRNMPLIVVKANLSKHFMCDEKTAKEMITKYISELKG